MTFRLLCGGLLLCLPAVSGCDGWPLYSVEADDRDTINASDDPRTKVDVIWRRFDEAETLVRPGADNGDPLNVKEGAVDVGEGVLVSGILRGVGWNADFEAPSVQSADCDPGQRMPSGEGDWAGDVDFYRVKVLADGVLCLRNTMSHPQVGWDLLLFPVEDCWVPRQPVQRDGAAAGRWLSGEVAGWKTPVQQGNYAVLIAGYDAPAGGETADYSYELGVALVADKQGMELCPTLGEEVEP